MGWSLDIAAQGTLLALIACGLVAMMKGILSRERCPTAEVSHDPISYTEETEAMTCHARPVTCAALSRGKQIRKIEREQDKLAMHVLDQIVFPQPRRWSRDTFDANARMLRVQFAGYIDPASNVMTGFIAFFIAPDKRVEILRLAVLSAARRAGIGTALVQHAVTAADFFDCPEVVCDVPDVDLAAHLLLRSNGFRCTQTFCGESLCENNGTIADTYRFRKRLDESERCGE